MRFVFGLAHSDDRRIHSRKVRVEKVQERTVAPGCGYPSE